MLDWLIPVLAVVTVLSVIGWVSYHAAKVVYFKLLKAGNARAHGWRVATFIATYLLIIFGLFMVVVYNLRVD